MIDPAQTLWLDDLAKNNRVAAYTAIVKLTALIKTLVANCVQL